MIRKAANILSAILALATMANAEDSKLETLDTWGRNRGWEGVGQLVIARRSTCTGTLIATDLVLTAAHCFVNSDHDGLVDPSQIEFRAGWRAGQAVSDRRGKALVLHPNYDVGAVDAVTTRQIRWDVALLQLDAPIPYTHADPFLTDVGIDVDEEVSVVSYGKGRNNAASRQRSCSVIDQRQGVAAMTCDAVPGSSGAPVFAMRDGRPRIVAVISAIGEVDGAPASFAMDIDRPLARVLSDFHAGRIFPQKATTARRLTVGEADNNQSGAKFVKP